MLAFAAPKDTMTQISLRKLSCIATKPQNLQKFSPSKVSRYTVNIRLSQLQLKYLYSYTLVCCVPELQGGAATAANKNNQ